VATLYIQNGNIGMTANSVADCPISPKFITVMHYGPSKLKSRSTSAMAGGLKLQCIANDTFYRVFIFIYK